MPEQESGSKIIKCRDCGEDFVFTTGEQQYYREKQLYEPRRCKPCRRQNKLAKEGR